MEKTYKVTMYDCHYPNHEFPGQMLWDNDESLYDNAYEDIVTSYYDSIVSVLDQAIDAYRNTDIYEITDDNEEQIIGTHKDKMNALANYLRRVANDIEEKD